MREGSPIQVSTTNTANGLQPDAKSLFRNILATSPYGSRFYEDPSRSLRCKLLRINILANSTKKYGEVFTSNAFNNLILLSEHFRSSTMESSTNFIPSE